MKKTIHHLAFLTLLSGLWAFSPSVSMSQESTTTSAVGAANADSSRFVQLTMNDGTLKFGQLIEITESEVVLDIMGLGITRIPKYLVQALTSEMLSEADQERGFGYISNQPSRYFFAPSGIQLKKGEGYFQSNVALNSISYGFSDRFTGGILLSVVGAGLTAKFGGQVRENVHVSVGGVAGIDYYGNLDRPLVLGFANVTFGDEDKNLTINLGIGNSILNGTSLDFNALSLDSTIVSANNSYQTNYFTATHEIENRSVPVLLNVSAMRPLTANRWFITENYWVRNLRYATRITGANLAVGYLPSNTTNFNAQSDGFAILSMGIRNLSTRNGWLWDYGMVGVVGSEFGFAAPWVSATLAF